MYEFSTSGDSHAIRNKSKTCSLLTGVTNLSADPPGKNKPERCLALCTSHLFIAIQICLQDNNNKMSNEDMTKVSEKKCRFV